MIDPNKYGTASEISKAVEHPRTTLINAVKRGEIKHCYTLGGTLLLSLTDAIRWAAVTTRKPGRKVRSG